MLWLLGLQKILIFEKVSRQVRDEIQFIPFVVEISPITEPAFNGDFKHWRVGPDSSTTFSFKKKSVSPDKIKSRNSNRTSSAREVV